MFFIHYFESLSLMASSPNHFIGGIMVNVYLWLYLIFFLLTYLLLLSSPYLKYPEKCFHFLDFFFVCLFSFGWEHAAVKGWGKLLLLFPLLPTLLFQVSSRSSIQKKFPIIYKQTRRKFQTPFSSKAGISVTTDAKNSRHLIVKTSLTGKPATNIHTWCTYIVFWLSTALPICFSGMVPAYQLVGPFQYTEVPKKGFTWVVSIATKVPFLL